MFIAHAPAGFITSHAVDRLPWRHRPERGRLFALGVACSVLPDLDLAYFYTLGARQLPHHEYWTHVPFAWACFFGMLAPLAVHLPRVRAYYAVAALNLFLHLALDSVASKILWLAPRSRAGFGLIEVPSGAAWWPMNFVTHWSFAIELAIVASALALGWSLATREAPRIRVQMEPSP